MWQKTVNMRPLMQNRCVRNILGSEKWEKERNAASRRDTTLNKTIRIHEFHERFQIKIGNRGSRIFHQTWMHLIAQVYSCSRLLAKATSITL